jgi:hypothetical protein
VGKMTNCQNCIYAVEVRKFSPAYGSKDALECHIHAPSSVGERWPEITKDDCCGEGVPRPRGTFIEKDYLELDKKP